MTDFRTLGYEAGQARASWVFDGNTDEATYHRVLQGLDDGDPEIIDALSISPLSGEMAGESMNEILGDDWTDEDADEYEDGFQEGYWSTIENTCTVMVDTE